MRGACVAVTPSLYRSVGYSARELILNLPIEAYRCYLGPYEPWEHLACPFERIFQSLESKVAGGDVTNR